jgi:hypothetical protein
LGLPIEALWLRFPLCSFVSSVVKDFGFTITRSRAITRSPIRVYQQALLLSFVFLRAFVVKAFGFPDHPITAPKAQQPGRVLGSRFAGVSRKSNYVTLHPGWRGAIRDIAHMRPHNVLRIKQPVAPPILISGARRGKRSVGIQRSSSECGLGPSVRSNQ